MVQDAYQEDVSFFIVQAVMPYLQNKNFIDIGAGQGLFSMPLIEQGFKGTLFEPVSKYHAHLTNLVNQNQTKCQFFPYALDDTDHPADFYLACDKAGKSLDYFHSLHSLKKDPHIQHSEVMSVMCRSLDSLVQEGLIADQVGILKTEVGSNDLNVLQGMTQLSAEVIFCEFFMPGVYEGWEQADPYELIKQAERLGFKHYVAIKRIGECALVSLKPDAFVYGQWGHLIFISDRIFEQCRSQLQSLIALSETKLFQVLRKKEADRVHASESHNAEGYPPKKSLYAKLKSFMKPRLNLSDTHPPTPIYIPYSYHDDEILKDPPLISIVTPSYNQSDFLERTLKSVLDQSYPRLEYIVQDGGSSDDSAAILQKYSPMLSHWESKRDKGQSNAINLGFKHATGEIMAYLNSDDLLLPGSLNYVAHFFQTHPDVDVVYGHRILIDEFDNEIGRWILPKHDNKILSWADYVPQETLFWRRSIWDKVGGEIDESFQFAMDWDLILRFRDAGAKFVRLPRFLGAFRVHQSQKSLVRIKDTGMKEMSRLRQRCHGRKVSELEIRFHTFGYLLRHLIHQKLLHRLGLINY